MIELYLFAYILVGYGLTFVILPDPSFKRLFFNRLISMIAVILFIALWPILIPLYYITKDK